MKSSIQNKIIIVILVGILFSSLTIGSLGIVSFHEELEKSINSTMNLTCQEKAEALNNVLGRIEQSTEVMAVLCLNYISNEANLKDETYRSEYIEHLMHAGHNIANNTQGAVGIYFRLNPEIAGPTEGFYWLLDEESGNLEIKENTNITAFEKSDIEHVGWYYIPVEAGTAVWMDPYENQNINRMIVSYTMPIYRDEQLIGIVGMDIDWAYITDMIDEIQVYETGYAFLADENYDITYSKEFEAGTNISGFSDELTHINVNELTRSDRVYELDFKGDNRTAAFTLLNSGKIMAVIAPNQEIYADFNALVIRIVSLALFAGLIFVFVTIQIARTIIRPLKELDKAAKDIAQGQLNVELNICSNDEVGTLAQSLQETAQQLKIKIDYINNLAYTDKLTGIKNSTAYLQEVTYLKSDILLKKACFSIFVVDVNGLKQVNDTYGHEMGNELLIKATHLIAEVFGSDNLYRIGGDEFAVIAYDISEAECETCKKRFEDMIDTQKGKVWASASIGSATYDSRIDTNYESVFNRADEEMYEKKVRMKEEGKLSRVEKEML